MAYPTEVDAVAAAPSGNLGTTTPTHRQSHDQYRSALLSIKAKIDSLPTANVIPAGSSLATVQSAVNATDATFGGTIVLSPGEYDWASGHLTLPTNRQITIDGYGANIFYSGTTGAVIDGVDVNNITLRGFRLWGPGQTTGSGNGIAFSLSSADNTPYINIEDVQCWTFGGSGFVLPGLIVSGLSNCVSTSHGGYGFDLTQTGFGTSVTFDNCFGNDCRKAAYRLTRMTYCTFNSCATDDCGIGYELVDCSAIHLSGCGCEVPKDVDAIVGGSTYDNYFGVAYKVTGGTSITFTSCFVLGLATSPGGDVGWWFTGSSVNCVLVAPFEVDPGTTPEAALKVDSGSSVTVVAPRFLSPVTGSGTVLSSTAEAYQNHGNTSTTETIDLANGTVHRIVLDANCTLTFTGSAAGAAYSFTLVVVQDGTGSRTITWPASVDWANATAPTLSTGANKVDVLTFMTIDGGTTWLGFTAGLDLR